MSLPFSLLVLEIQPRCLSDFDEETPGIYSAARMNSYHTAVGPILEEGLPVELDTEEKKNWDARKSNCRV